MTSFPEHVPIRGVGVERVPTMSPYIVALIPPDVHVWGRQESMAHLRWSNDVVVVRWKAQSARPTCRRPLPKSGDELYSDSEGQGLDG